MIQKLKMMLLFPGVLSIFLVPALALPMTVLADHNPIHTGLCTGADLNTTTGDCDEGTINQGGFQTTLENIINIISIIVGIVAVLMIIYGGFRYITSGGDATKVTAAKNTILYGLIGLIIVALAQIIVKFVINQISDATSTP